MKGLWARAWAAALALGVAALVQGADEATIYGKRLVQSSDVPAEALARFAQHDAKLKAKGEKPGFMSFGVDWLAPEMPAPSEGNPYRLVVRVAGTALSDGDAASLWTAGWSEGGQMRVLPVTGTLKSGAKAGERVELVGASGPVSFKEDHTRVPALSFQGAQNLRIDEVRFEVWGGVGKATFVERLWAWSPLLVGVVFLGLFLWWRR
jgi:hypothetical protein